jgi:hypothetical protein
MNMKKSLIIILVILVLVTVFFSTGCQERTAPTIELKIYDGPEYVTGFCVYRVEAVVTGYPEPEVSFSKDDSNGSYGRYKVQINLRNPEEPYLLEAKAKNSIGEATSQLLIEWGCEEEVVKYTETEEEILSELEFALLEIEEEKIREHLTEKTQYIKEAIQLEGNNKVIENLFNNLLEHYSLRERIFIINAFLELEFDEKIIKALIIKLEEAGNKLDADEDGFTNFSEITGLDNNYNPLPFEENGKPIKYINETGIEVHRSHSNPLDPKDTPEHMARFDFVFIQGNFIPGNSEKDTMTMERYVNRLIQANNHFLGGNFCLDEQFSVIFLDNPISFSEIYKTIENFSDNDYIFVMWVSHGGPSNIAFLGSEEVTEQDLLNLCNLLFKKYGEGAILDYTTCHSGCMSRIPESGIFVFQATDCTMVTAGAAHYFAINNNLYNQFPFIDLGKAHNVAMDFQYHEEQDGSICVLGAQYCVKKIEDNSFIYWDRNGIFEFAKDNNSNYITWPEGHIIRNHLAYPKVEDGQGDYALENGEYVLSENGNYTKVELTKEQEAPRVTNFFMDYFFK